MSDDKIDVLLQYQSISNKLRKKRILKKPNVSEASQQFENLGKICDREDLDQYAGLSYEAAAKCQNSLGNQLEENVFLLKSSKHFMSAYLKLLDSEFVSNEAYLGCSYSTYNEFLERLKDNKELSKLAIDMIAGSATLEMGDTLKSKIGIVEASCPEYEKALEFFSKSPVEKINCLEKLVSVKILLGDYSEALKLINKIVIEAELLPEGGLKSDTQRISEITRIFLLLILQPTPQQISSSDASALEKYAWVETFESSEVKDLGITLNVKGLSMLNENLFLTLQSLVMACQYCDIEALEPLQADLMPYLNLEQKILLRVLLKQYMFL